MKSGMELNKYQGIISMFNVFKPELAMFYYLAGLAREAQELREAVEAPGDKLPLSANWLDEQGDVLWFCASTLRELNFPLDPMYPAPPAFMEIEPLDWQGGDLEMAYFIEHQAGLILDAYVKAIRDYGQPIAPDGNNQVFRLIMSILYTLQNWLGAGNLSLEDVAQANYDKLIKRHAKRLKLDADSGAPYFPSATDVERHLHGEIEHLTQ